MTEEKKQDQDKKKKEERKGKDEEGHQNSKKEIDTETETEESESEKDYKEKWMRAQADYQNLKKSLSDKRQKMKKRAEFNMLEKFIPVFENFKKAYDHKPQREDSDLKNWRNWAQGMEFILKKFEDILQDHGVEKIKAEGRDFDPNLHTAAAEKYSEEVEEGQIIEVLEQGYKSGERVLKPAKVVVSKGEEN